MEQKYILYIILAFLLGFLLKLLLDRKYCNNEQFFIDIPIKQKISLLKNSNALSSLDNILNDNIPWGIYSAETWNSSNNILPDLTGNGRDATTTNVTLNLGQGNGAVNNINYLSGDMTSSILWPTGSIPANFTICSVTRYKGTNNGRILHSTTGNWLHGHWHKSRGVAYYEGWKTQESKGSVNDWVVCCGQNNGSIIVDDVTVAQSVNGAGNYQLGINKNDGSCCPNENSDWEFSLLIIWDKTLSTQDLQLVSKGLNNYLKSTTPPPVTPATASLDTLQSQWNTIGCKRNLTENDVAWWRTKDNDTVKNDMSTYYSLASTCTGTQGQNDFCLPNSCKPPPTILPTPEETAEETAESSSDVDTTPAPPSTDTTPIDFTSFSKKIIGKSKNGKTIKRYNNIQKCVTDCSTNKKCVGIVINQSGFKKTGSICKTIKDFSKPHNNPNAIAYLKK